MVMTRQEAIEKVYNEQLEALVRFEIDIKLYEAELSPEDPFKRTPEEVKQIEASFNENKRKVYSKEIIVKGLKEMLDAEVKVAGA
jgi:hypothetical protein